ncbi:MAG: DNA replication/repair protein RecF [Clostridia bacterium]|nr:DNA replication/repair protein RecF [Clostridia bacterium]
MYIKEIYLKDFRNYESLLLQFDKNVNIISGDNAQGKTNLLEAIYISSLLKSFRTSKDHEMISFNKNAALVKIGYVKDDYDEEIEIIIDKENGKNVKLNGVKLKKASEVLDNIYTVIFTPDDLSIVQDEPEKRRKFLDRELCQIKTSYYMNLANYRRVLLQRNAYLKEPRVDREILSVWDNELSKYGADIIHERKKFIDKLSVVSSRIHKSITDGREDLIVRYIENVKYVPDRKKQMEYFYEKLQASFENDMMRRTTTAGPHKDDLEFIIKDKDKEINARAFGSQGQQRTVSLSVKLSEIDIIKEETGETPVLLLDDVLSELDLKRQEFLIKTLSDVQLFISTAELSDDLLKRLPEGNTYVVENGKIVLK